MAKKKKDDVDIELEDEDDDSLDFMDDDKNSQEDDSFNDLDIDDGFDFDGGAGGMAPIDKHRDLLRDLTNFDPYLKDTFNTWLGLIWDEETQKFSKSTIADPVMNYKGASWCISLLKTYTRPNNIITHIRQEEYINMMTTIIEVIFINLGTRMEEFGIKHNGDLITIATQLQHSAELILMGAGDGKYNKLLQTTVSRSESVNVGPPQGQYQQHPIGMSQPEKRKGMMGRIRGMFGGTQ